MSQELLAVGLVFGLGVGSQVLADRLRIPSIILLLSVGILAGPVLRSIPVLEAYALRPDELLGDMLGPLVSVAVGIILFEGGLTLRFRELKSGGGVMWRLVSLGALVTWSVAAGGAALLLGFPIALAALFGAVLTVSGPTVVLPLLRHVRPRGPVSSVLKWEGIVIDPIGATLAVLVYEFISAGSRDEATQEVVVSIVSTVLAGGGLGFVFGRGLASVLKRFVIPDFLQNPATLALVILVFVLAESVQKEAGLLATTVMGITLANQRRLQVDHIVEFKENLTVLLISALFVVLASRLTVEDIRSLGLESVAFLGVLILIARPLAVLVSTIGSRLRWNERVMLAAVAPRGIVAAALAPVFALDLEAKGIDEAGRLTALTFAVIIGTVVFYGGFAGVIARALRLSDTNPQGLLILGGHAWARAIAKTLNDLGVRAMICDTNYQNTSAAWMDGVPAYHGNLLHESALDGINLTGIGRFVALTPNDGVNTLASRDLERLLGRKSVYQLDTADRTDGEAGAERGRARTAFREGASYGEMSKAWAASSQVALRRLGLEEQTDEPHAALGEGATAMFVVTDAGRLAMVSPDTPQEFEGPAWIVGLAPPTRPAGEPA
ncbi:MAG: sodium:proton antiporter [Planctomycetota bacterium]